jgi:hypothetical protein
LGEKSDASTMDAGIEGAMVTQMDLKNFTINSANIPWNKLNTTAYFAIFICGLENRDIATINMRIFGDGYVLIMSIHIDNGILVMVS